MFYWFCWALLSRVLLWPPTRRRVVGFDRLPAPPFLLAMNHVSHFDPPLVTSCFPLKIDFMGFSGLFRAPLSGWLCRACDVFPVHRGRTDPAAVLTAVQRLKAGRVVGLFAEGGIRSGSESVLGGQPLLPGAASIALTAGVPIVPCLLIGSDQLYDRRLALRRPVVLLAAGPPLRSRPARAPKVARAELTDRLGRALRQLYWEAEQAGLISEAMRPRTAQERWAQ